MTDDEWARLTTPQKLDWIRNELAQQGEQGNRIANRLQQVHRSLVSQLAPIVDQIGTLTAKVEALEQTLDNLRDHKE